MLALWSLTNMRWSSMPLDAEGWIRREIAERHGPTRAVCRGGDDRAVGRVAVRPPECASAAVRCEAIRDGDQPAGEISYWLIPDARGHGVAEAAVRSMMTTVIPQLDIASLVFDIEPSNAASIKLAQRLGAQRRFPSRIERDRAGVPRELVVFVLPLNAT